MKSRRISFTLMLTALATLCTPLVAAAQSPGNRALSHVAITPSPGAGGQTVSAVWAIAVEETTAPFDLSTEVALLLNGTELSSQTVPITIDAGSGFGCEDGGSCNGSCGTATIGGAGVSLICYEDGECTPTLCDCDCGAWIMTEFPGVPLAPGDEIMVLLRPAPGAIPDDDGSDDSVLTTYHGQPVGWNRALTTVEVVETMPGRYDVEVGGTAGWESRAGGANLDFDVELRVNGVLRTSITIPMALDGPFDQTCFQVGCGSQCGTVNGVPAFCDEYLWWDCGCGGGWIGTFPDPGLEPGDVLEVILRPVPGALPELPGFGDDDDELGVTCCPVVAVGSGPTERRSHLAQNRPNPFNPMTSIAFELGMPGRVSLAVFDLGGRKVRSLLDRALSVGSWTATWDGKTDHGTAAPSGQYFYRLTTPEGVMTRRMTLLK